MTPEQIKELATTYKKYLTEIGYGSSFQYLGLAAPFDRAGRKPLTTQTYYHLQYMLDEILAGRIIGEKLHRWLGFLQGVLWCNGDFTIKELKDHNRSKETID